MIYLDNAATTYPKPIGVYEMMRAAPRKYGANPGRSSYKMCQDTMEKIYSVRKKLCKMFNAPGEEYVVFTSNCTSALNIAIKGLSKNCGHAVTSDLEHNSVMRPLYRLEKEKFFYYETAKTEFQKDKTVRNFEYKIRKNTNFICCTYSSNVFGDILPITQIGELAKDAGIPLVVDAAQAAGVIEIDMKRDNISFLCMPGHKGLYGMMGTGVLILGSDKYLDTLYEGGTGSESKSFEQPEILPDRFESGTVNTPGIICLGKGVDFVNNIGINKIHNHETMLIKYLYDNLENDKSIQLYNVYHPERYAPILSFNIKGIPSEKTAELLGDKGIAVRGGFHCNPNAHIHYNSYETGTVRVSVSYFNTKKDMDYLLNSIKKIANNKNICYN